MVGGLNIGSTALTEELGIVLYRIQLLGFNTRCVLGTFLGVFASFVGWDREASPRQEAVEAVEVEESKRAC